MKLSALTENGFPPLVHAISRKALFKKFEMSRKLYLHQIGQRTPRPEIKKPKNEINIPFQYLIKNLELMTKQRFYAMNSRQRTRFKWWAKLQNFEFEFLSFQQKT